VQTEFYIREKKCKKGTREKQKTRSPNGTPLRNGGGTREKRRQEIVKNQMSHRPRSGFQDKKKKCGVSRRSGRGISPAWVVIQPTTKEMGPRKKPQTEGRVLVQGRWRNCNFVSGSGESRQRRMESERHLVVPARSEDHTGRKGGSVKGLVH